MSAGIPLGGAACVASGLELWCDLKPRTGCVGSGSTWMGFSYWSLSDAGLNYMSVAPTLFTGPGVHGRSFSELRVGRSSVKAPRLPDVYLNTSTIPPPPEPSPKPSKRICG